MRCKFRESLLNENPRLSEIEESSWAQVLRAIEVECALLGTWTRAIRRALLRGRLARVPIVQFVFRLKRKLRLLLSRTQWTVRLLQLWKETSSESTPGLIIIQIDGLSQRQLHHAMRNRKMPFLRHLLATQGYHEYTVYTGLPSTTA